MPRRPTLAIAAVLAGIVLLVAGCTLPDLPGRGAGASDRGGRATASTRPARVTPREPGPTWATGATVRVVMNDRFRYRPNQIMVAAGRTVTFAVTNVGKLPHEFVLGDRATQLDHERQMQAAATGSTGTGTSTGTGGGHAHAHGSHAPAGASAKAGALTVPPGQTKRLTWTFEEPGIVLYGCHVLGHWAAGMKGTILVVSRISRLSPAPPQPDPLGRRPANR